MRVVDTRITNALIRAKRTTGTHKRDRCSQDAIIKQRQSYLRHSMQDRYPLLSDANTAGKRRIDRPLLRRRGRPGTHTPHRADARITAALSSHRGGSSKTHCRKHHYAANSR